MFLIFDTETTGLPRDYNAPHTDTDNWPRLVQLAWQLHDIHGELIEVKNFIVKPDGFTIPFNAEKIHGISTDRAERFGMPLAEVLEEFNKALEKADYNVGHNIGFDINIMACEYHRTGIETPLQQKNAVDTKSDDTAAFCQIRGGKGGRYKWPTLTELHQKLFNEGFDEAHNASADVEATARVFLELVRTGVISASDLDLDPSVIQEFRERNPKPFELIGLNIEPYDPGDLEGETQPEKTKEEPSKEEIESNLEELQDVRFSHLHNHTQFSILRSTTDVKGLVGKAVEYGMPAIAITDQGNLMGAFQFVREVENYNKSIEEDSGKKPLKGIVGCELFVCRNREDRTKKDDGYQIPFIAKNKAGYHNLARLSSEGYINGFYYVPRIDREFLLRYKDDLIVTTGSIYGEVPSLILNVGEEKAEKAFLWWKEQFGDDFYAELLRHGLEEEDRVNQVLLEFCKKHDVKYFAANDTYYLDEDDAEAHDVLLCIKEGERKSTPIGRGRGYRYGFPNDQYFFKSPQAMKELFKDLPEAIATTGEIVEKIEPFSLARDVLLPKFTIPEQYRDSKDDEDGGNRGENAFLRALTYQGAERRYPEITEEIKERLDFELETIANTGYPGYFLIVQDFCNKARELGVWVGPGRGSAAGSAVAYCIGITNVDPIEYNLLFERFLNPDRISLPDIDIDFDDDGRGKVIDYVIDKYGSEQVAQIITYGTMAAKSSIRDAGRVLELPLPDTDRLAKLVPDTKLNKLFGMDEKAMKEKLKGDQLEKGKELKKIAEGSDLEAKTINQAVVLEGSLRNTGIHACGVIITPSDIRELVPVATAKDQSLWCTQFDNSVVEDAGLLKMDFLGLKTLTLIRDACAIVKEIHGKDLVPDEFPLDDETTYKLFQRGETVGIFQYESGGMQMYLKELKPSAFEDLIAMNALYRPGPMEYIPSFIKRKHGQEEITYDLEAQKEILEETYGITVYQEQVMLLSQKLAGFSKGEADVLRKAMGKKILSLLETLKPKFLDGCEANGHDRKIAEKIWKDWEAFASYAFNKSHSTCYAWVAYQTAYLKANYPAEYMASVLSNNMSDIKQVTFFMEECRRMGIKVLGPDVNESVYKFTVNDNGEIRFGMGAIKGVGGGAVESILKEREESGAFTSVFDFIERIDLRAVNKKCIENLVLAGALDGFSTFHRAQYFAEMDTSGGTFIDHLHKYGSSFQQSKNAPPDLFGDSVAVEVQKPMPAPVETWNSIDALNRERDVVGLYISAHPLDDFRLEIENFCRGHLGMLSDLHSLVNKNLSLAGIVTKVEHRLSQRNGTPFGIFEMEDYNSNYRFILFSDAYLKNKHYLVEGALLFVKGRVEMRKRRDSEEPEFRINSVQLLNELREKMVNKLIIDLELDELNDKVLENLESALPSSQESETPGCNVCFRVQDKVSKRRIKLYSRSRKIDLSNETIEQLDKIPGISYALNE